MAGSRDHVAKEFARGRTWLFFSNEPVRRVKNKAHALMPIPCLSQTKVQPHREELKTARVGEKGEEKSEIGGLGPLLRENEARGENDHKGESGGRRRRK